MKRTQKLEFFTTKQLGLILTASPRTLEGWRGRGKGPSYTRLGSARNAKVVYPRADVELWLSENRSSVVSRSTPAVPSPINDDGSMMTGPVSDAPVKLDRRSAVPQGRRSVKFFLAPKKMLGVAASEAREAVRRATQWRPRGRK